MGGTSYDVVSSHPWIVRYATNGRSPPDKEAGLPKVVSAVVTDHTELYHRDLATFMSILQPRWVGI